MFCPKCGTTNPDNASFCSKCGCRLSISEEQRYDIPQGSNYNNYNSRPDVPNYLVWSILATIFCCIPLGIPAIVYSSQVDTRLRSGDYQGAIESSQKAKKFCWIAFWCGFAAIIIYFIAAAAGTASFFSHI